MSKVKLDELSNSIKERFGEKALNKAEIISNERFGDKSKLKCKFYSSILEGEIDINQIWTSNDVVESIKNKIDSASEDKKIKIILDVIDGYDNKDPKTRELLKKYNRYLEKAKSGV